MEQNQNTIDGVVVEVNEEKKGLLASIKATKDDLKVKNQELVEKHPAIGAIETGAKIVAGGAALFGAFMLGKKSAYKIVDGEVGEMVAEQVSEVFKEASEEIIQ